MHKSLILIASWIYDITKDTVDGDQRIQISGKLLRTGVCAASCAAGRSASVFVVFLGGGPQ
jgi:hypothetical protein